MRGPVLNGAGPFLLLPSARFGGSFLARTKPTFLQNAFYSKSGR